MFTFDTGLHTGSSPPSGRAHETSLPPKAKIQTSPFKGFTGIVKTDGHHGGRFFGDHLVFSLAFNLNSCYTVFHEDDIHI